MEHMYLDFDWGVDYVMSDGATSIGSSAKKIWPELKAWLQCLFQVIRDLSAELRALVAEKTVRAELCKCLKTLSLVWSLVVFVAGWAALRAQYSTFPTFLAYVQKEYIDQCTYRLSGASPPGIPAATPCEPSVNILKFETEHRMSTLAEFLVDGIPNLGQWAVALLQCTATLPGGSGQWNSCNALPHCPGAVGIDSLAMRGHTAWGLSVYVFLPSDTACSLQHSGTCAMHYHAARGQQAVQLLQFTASLPRGSGRCNSRNALPHCPGAVGSGTPAMHTAPRQCGSALRELH